MNGCSSSSSLNAWLPCENAFDSNTSSSWIANTEGSGSWLGISFAKNATIKRMQFQQHVPSPMYPTAQIQALSLHFSDGSVQFVRPQAISTTQSFELAPVASAQVRFIVEATYGQGKAAAASISFLGHGGTPLGPFLKGVAPLPRPSPLCHWPNLTWPKMGQNDICACDYGQSCYDKTWSCPKEAPHCWGGGEVGDPTTGRRGPLGHGAGKCCQLPPYNPVPPLPPLGSCVPADKQCGNGSFQNMQSRDPRICRQCCQSYLADPTACQSCVKQQCGRD